MTANAGPPTVTPATWMAVAGWLGVDRAVSRLSGIGMLLYSAKRAKTKRAPEILGSSQQAVAVTSVYFVRARL